jgi:hypothetical protein
MNAQVQEVNGSRLTKFCISSVIMTTLFLQFHAGLFRMACKVLDIPLLCRLPQDPGLYPFLNYPMYSSAKEEGVSVGKNKLIAVLEDSSEEELTAEELGISAYRFARDLLPAIKEDDRSTVIQYIDMYAPSHSQRIQSLRWEKNFVSITPQGLTSGQPETFLIMHID